MRPSSRWRWCWSVSVGAGRRAGHGADRFCVRAGRASGRADRHAARRAAQPPAIIRGRAPLHIGPTVPIASIWRTTGGAHRRRDLVA